MTNRQDLTTFQIITLYAYRWQIELFFRFLKRTMGGIHLVRHDSAGTTIQFYIMMTLALLELHLKQEIMDEAEMHENKMSGTQSEKEGCHGKSNTRDSSVSHARQKVDNSRLGDAGFLASLGACPRMKLNKYNSLK